MSGCRDLAGWDDFHRSNRNLDGDQAPSGQEYFAGGETLRILRQHYVSDPGPAVADILYMRMRTEPTLVAAEYVFTPGQTGVENVVVGTARETFGSMGSVQLAVWMNEWQFFYVTYPIVAPYPVIAQGSFDPPLDVDGHTSYRFGLRRVGPSTVIVDVPGRSQRFTDPHIDTYWGRTFGVQLRRHNDTDGAAQFTAIAAATRPLTTPEAHQVLGTPGLGVSDC